MLIWILQNGLVDDRSWQLPELGLVDPKRTPLLCLVRGQNIDRKRLHENHYDSVSVRPGNKPSTVIESPCEAFLPNLCNFCKEEIVIRVSTKTGGYGIPWLTTEDKNCGNVQLAGLNKCWLVLSFEENLWSWFQPFFLFDQTSCSSPS
jgi:hypothetical protein